MNIEDMAELLWAAVADLAVKISPKKVSGLIEYGIDFESNQEKLQHATKLIKDALLDADLMSEQCTDIDEHKLEEIIVRWNDLADLRASRQLRSQVRSGGNFIETILSFFFPSNPMVACFEDARKADEIKKVGKLSMSVKLLQKFESLRLLDLHRVGIKKLPTSVGDLICLRFVNMRGTEIRKLPNSITRLVNLQTLDLRDCDNLEELPRDMSKLVKLRHLLLKGSKKLRHTPMGLWNLRNLITLDTFIVGKQFESEASIMGRQAHLDQMDNLRGRLDFKVRRESKYIALSEISAINLKMKKNLQKLSLSFENGTKEDKWVLECLRPHPNLKTLTIYGYGGERLPEWMMDYLHNHLPSLKNVTIKNCKSCKYVCSFGSLSHLKYLCLRGLEEVEYVEDVTDNDNNENELSQAPLFPSLKFLVVKGMPKLKGWWRMSSSEQEDLNVHVQHQDLVNWTPAFPRLRTLIVDSVELAIAIARQQIGGFTSLKLLTVSGSSIGDQSHQQQAVTVPFSSCFPNLLFLQFASQRLEVLPEGIQYLSSLQSLSLFRLENIKAIPEWIDSLASLRSLSFEACPRLESLPHQIVNLPNLNTLSIHTCPQIKEKCQSPNGEYWPFILHIPHLKIL